MTPRVSVPLALLLVLTSASLAGLIYYGQWFPPVMAVHFNAAGDPDGWLDRLKFIVIASSTSLMVPAFVVTLLGVMPRVLPPSHVNVPNRAYWMAPERREATLQRLLLFALWLGCLVQAFLIGVWIFISLANPNGAPAHQAGRPLLLIGAFVILILIWKRRLATAFAEPK